MPSIPFDKVSTATCQVQYEDNTEKCNDELRDAFNNHVQKAGHYKTSSFYKEVKCLLISWDDDCDDLHTGPEVDALANVLEKKMHFKVTRALLTDDGNHPAHFQVVRHIINFIWSEDGPQTLLLFYYAGHGSPNKRVHSEDAEQLNDVVWAHLEDNFQHTKADVLEIFDCCYAGDLEDLEDTRQGWGSKSFEFLGACCSGNQTRSPGEESFTTALIWALNALLENHIRFTVAQLSRKIREAPNFPKDQYPVQLDRSYNAIERIVLAPLAETDGKTEATPNDSNDTNDNQGHLTLKFVFDKVPSTQTIKTFAKSLDLAIRKNEIPIKRIGWGGFQPPRNAYYAAAKMFMEGYNRKKSKTKPDENDRCYV
ncbi:Phosphatidylinositol-4-phosphate 5-kinase [Sticta canariensis]|nr:Phosphatidylinositol-4-phosphate 5-kinase [Sticta canariensis]